MQPVVAFIHGFFVGVEALDSQPHHRGEEMVLRLVPGPDCKEGGRKSASWRAWLKHLCELRCGAARRRAGERRL